MIFSILYSIVYSICGNSNKTRRFAMKCPNCLTYYNSGTCPVCGSSSKYKATTHSKGIVVVLIFISLITYFFKDIKNWVKPSVPLSKTVSNNNLYGDLSKNIKTEITQFTAGQYTVRIDYLDNNTYRYICWDYTEDITQKTSLVLNNGYFSLEKNAFVFETGSNKYYVKYLDNKPYKLEVYYGNKQKILEPVNKIAFSSEIVNLAKLLSDNGITYSTIEHVKEKEERALVILDKKSELPKVLIINKLLNKIEFLEKGKISKTLDIAIKDKSSLTHWVFLLTNEVENNSKVIDIRMKTLDYAVLHKDLANANYVLKKADTNSDGFKDLVISINGDRKIFLATNTMFRERNN